MVDHTVGVSLEQLWGVVGREVDYPYDIGVNIDISIRDGENDILLVALGIKVGGQGDVASDQVFESGEHGVGIVVDDSVGVVVEATIDEVEGAVVLAGRRAHPRYGHCVVACCQLRGVCEREDDEIVHAVQTVKRVQD